jgi:hypothetical protein
MSILEASLGANISESLADFFLDLFNSKARERLHDGEATVEREGRWRF